MLGLELEPQRPRTPLVCQRMPSNGFGVTLNGMQRCVPVPLQSSAAFDQGNILRKSNTTSPTQTSPLASFPPNLLTPIRSQVQNRREKRKAKRQRDKEIKRARKEAGEVVPPKLRPGRRGVGGPEKSPQRVAIDLDFDKYHQVCVFGPFVLLTLIQSNLCVPRFDSGSVVL